MIELPMAPLVPAEAMDGDEEQTVMGLRHCHQQLNTLAQQLFDAAAQVGAVVAALHARGLLSEEELAQHRQAEEQRLDALFQQRKIGVRIDENTPDKYDVPPDEIPAIDCASRYHLCHAACCALRFPLSRQDLDEGVVRWELGQPYLNRQGRDGFCVHLDRAGRHCTIYAQRPGICRIYDCRDDSRIWLDFERGIVNPELFEVREETGERRPQFPKRRVRLSNGAAGDDEMMPTAPAGEAAPDMTPPAQAGGGQPC